MKASDEIERGGEPTSPLVIARALGATDTRFDLNLWPWGAGADYMLIVAGNNDTAIDVRISYGK